MNQTGTEKTEVHILDGATNYSSYLLQVGTAQHETDTSQYQFFTTDYNLDSHPDLYFVKMNDTGTGTTEVHILDGANQYQSFLLHTSSGLL